MLDDGTLLRQFVHERSDAAFRTFVERHFNFVYAAALRHVNGEVHLAQEIAQSVFIAATRKARQLAHRQTAAGWLYQSTRYAALAAMRAKSRRTNYERKAEAMAEVTRDSNREVDWDAVRPVVDDALSELGQPDREAILLRFFADKNFSEIGAMLGLGENGARMRVQRALEKLRRRLACRHITSTSAALAAALADGPMIAAPLGMASAAATRALRVAAATAGAGLTAHFESFLTMNAVKSTLVGIAMASAALAGLLWGSRHPRPSASGADASAWRTRITALEADNRQLRESLRLAETRPASREVNERGNAATITPVDVLKIVADLQERRLVGTLPSRFPFGDDGRIRPTFFQLYALDSAEQLRLQQSVDRIRAKLAKLEEANGTVTRESDGSVRLTVQPFPSDGGKVYDEFLADFAQILGPERYQAFVKIGLDGFETALGKFGTTQNTYVFGYEPGNPERRVLKFTSTLTIPNGSRLMTESKSFETVSSLKAYIGPIAEILPADYGLLPAAQGTRTRPL